MLDIVTVVFSRELPLLELQARSMDRFLSPDGIGRIVLIVNDVDEAGCARRIEAMRAAWGRHEPRVEVVGADAIFALRPAEFAPRGFRQTLRHWYSWRRGLYPLGLKGGWRGNRGWAVQQAAKLAVSRHGDSKFVLILDAKNHFVRDVSVGSFVSAAGRPKSCLVLPNDEQWSWVLASCRRMGVAPPPRGFLVPPTVTPVCAAREALRGCLEDFERVAGPAESFFARKKTRETEFMLLFAHVVARHGEWSALFDPGLVPSATIFSRSDETEIEAAIARAETGEAEIFSVHDSRVGGLSPEQRRRIRALWAARGLPPLAAA